MRVVMDVMLRLTVRSLRYYTIDGAKLTADADTYKDVLFSLMSPQEIQIVVLSRRWRGG